MYDRRSFLKIGVASVATTFGFAMKAAGAISFVEPHTSDWLQGLDAVAQSELIRRGVVSRAALVKAAHDRMARFAASLEGSGRLCPCPISTEADRSSYRGVFDGVPTIEIGPLGLSGSTAGMIVAGRSDTSAMPHSSGYAEEFVSAGAVGLKIVPAAVAIDGFAARVRRAASAWSVAAFLPSASHESLGGVHRLTAPAWNRTAWLSRSTRDLAAFAWDARCVRLGKADAWPELKAKLAPGGHSRRLRVGVHHSFVEGSRRDIALHTTRLLEELGHVVEFCDPERIAVGEFEKLVVQLWAAEAQLALRTGSDRRNLLPTRMISELDDRLLQHAASLTGASYQDARARARILADALLAWWKEYDVLVMADSMAVPDSLDDQLVVHARTYGLPMLTGQPVLSLPLRARAAVDPVNAQFIGNLGSDDLLLSLAREIEYVAQTGSRVAAHERANPV